MGVPSQFEKIEFRVGEIKKVEHVSVENHAAYKITIGFGEEIGDRKATLKIADSYNVDELIGKKIIGIVNFAPKKVEEAYINDVHLPVGIDPDGKQILITTDHYVPIGNNLQLAE